MIRTNASACFPARISEAAREHIELIRYILNDQKEEASAAITLHLIKSKEAAVNSLFQKQISAI